MSFHLSIRGKVSAEAIEALARRNYEAAMSAPWEGVMDSERGDWIEEAFEQCEIIAPSISATAWGEGEAAGWKNATAAKRGTGLIANPYRSADA